MITSSRRVMPQFAGSLLAAWLIALPASLSAATIWTGNFGHKNITVAGTYQLGPDASGNQATGSISVNCSGAVIIEGTGGVVRDFYTDGSVSNPSSVIDSSGSGTTTVRNLIVHNQGSFGVTIRGGTGNSITNCKVLNITSGATQDGFGLATGASGSITNCTTRVGDDSYKLYGPNTSASNCTAEQLSNGSCIQFGWGSNASGNSHVANIITCKSATAMTYSPGGADDGGTPGRAVVGWSKTNSGACNTVKATNLTVANAGNNWNHTININMSGGGTCTTMEITGSFSGALPTKVTRNDSSGVPHNYTPIKVNITGAGTQISGFTVNFGGVFTNSALVYISNPSKVTGQSIQ